MSLLNTLRKIGADISTVTVSYRNKETGEQIRGAKINNASLDVFTDPQLRLNALATCSGKTVGFSVTDPANPDMTNSTALNPFDAAAILAHEAGMMGDYERFLAARDDGSSMEAIQDATKSALDAARNQAAQVRNAISKQAREAIAKRTALPTSKPKAVKPEAAQV